ncbi:uncharacterized protein ARMOST_20759 [Armillaria ostoyae]|uniref:Uncharacterized protein n=1 Tax=Armillaria ostoyae TaxID=47428 RepID=A0A284S896_ARMOS|nr:uncharacterized protein ARMOST_20759 [Armillaria ostoyae]
MVSALSTAHPRHQELVKCITSHFQSDLKTIRILSLVTRAFGTLTRDYIFTSIVFHVLPHPTFEPMQTASNLLCLFRSSPSRASLVKALKCTPESLLSWDADTVLASLTSLQELQIFQEDDDLDDPYGDLRTSQLLILSALPIERLRLSGLRFRRFYHLHDLLCKLPPLMTLSSNSAYLRIQKVWTLTWKTLFGRRTPDFKGLKDVCFSGAHSTNDYQRISDLLRLCQDSVPNLALRYVQCSITWIDPTVLPIGRIETLRFDIDYCYETDQNTVQWWVSTFEQVREPGPLRSLYINVTGRCSKEKEYLWDKVDVSLSRDVFVHLETVKLFVEVSGMREVLRRRLARLQSQGVLEVFEGLEAFGLF